MNDVCGLIRPAAPRLRREVGAVGLGEQPLAWNGARGLTQLLGLREGDVAGEGEVIAALDCDRQELGRREAVQDDGARKRLQRGGRLLGSRACVDDDRLAELCGQLQLALE